MRQLSATHSYARRALEERLTKGEIKQVALLAIPTLGFPQGVKALTWVEDIPDADGCQILAARAGSLRLWIRMCVTLGRGFSLRWTRNGAC
ncbi:hypothetical protein SAMN05444161_8335 [Rhizobiales bacterium GAS191]|nr:hypothetical protein SAMN05444161_8335 [Rhizobiales bacterium GAS191]